MAVKIVMFICAQALVLQSISGQCIEDDLGVRNFAAYSLDEPSEGLFVDGAFGAGGLFGNGRLYSSALSSIAAGTLSPSAASASHRVLPVSSVSVIAPNGITVSSENAYTGDLDIRGALPFLGTMSLEGALPNIGTGSVAYNCGNGAVAILAENIGAAGIAGPFSYGGNTLGYGGDILGYRGDTLGYGDDILSYRGDTLGYGDDILGYRDDTLSYGIGSIAGSYGRIGCEHCGFI